MRANCFGKIARLLRLPESKMKTLIEFLISLIYAKFYQTERKEGKKRTEG